ncbi:MAG: hypothetical protein KatS3mg019_1306 [Fimbriimonadales bacterium]|nr:MAG: hypothetical protein KatS3mg019_1306 [Fimbriimonadales bacterium]
MTKTGRSNRFGLFVLWLTAISLLVGTTPRTFELIGKWREAQRETAQVERELLALQQQEHALIEQLQRVQTDLGRESLARQRGWIRKGEEPLRLNP